MRNTEQPTLHVLCATKVGSDDGNVVHSPTLTEAEQRAHFSLWAAVKSPMVLGNDPRNMSAATLEILLNKEVGYTVPTTAESLFGSFCRTDQCQRPQKDCLVLCYLFM